MRRNDIRLGRATPDWRWLALGVAISCLAVRAARADGPVIGWGNDTHGEATPPPSVDGTAGT
ncbi:MAG TPA: hypothetical protein VMU39_16145, partial [Solirubrobacteraceae bacterium]|nr:hypothetical protein [Solirubrobacteraceae bacterium]